MVEGLEMGLLLAQLGIDLVGLRFDVLGDGGDFFQMLVLFVLEVVMCPVFDLLHNEFKYYILTTLRMFWFG